MASNAQKCFRTVTRFGLFKQLTGGILAPIAIATPPVSITTNPGDSIEEPTEMNCNGEEVVSFTYTKSLKAELGVEFSMSVLELEAIIHGRYASSASNVECMVFNEFVPTSTSVAGRSSGQIGYDVVAQVAASTTAQAWYLDPDTKLARKITIVDSSPTGDQMIIGNNYAITVSSALATSQPQIYVWCPCVVPTATVMGSESTGIMTMYAQGINFDNSARTMIARNISRLPGDVGGDSKRTLKFRILPDPLDGTGLGYSFQDTKLTNVC